MSTAPGGVYYVRWRGEESGPYERAALRAMLDRGQVTRHHQVSTDRETWQPLFQALGPPPVPPPASAPGPAVRAPSVGIGPPAVAAAPAPEPRAEAAAAPPVLRRSTPEGADACARPEDPSVPGDRWYYLDQGQSCGPVESGRLCALADMGVLHADALVCREGHASWEPIRSFGPLLEGVVVACDAAARDRAGAPPAGFWRRLFALLLDGLILGCLCVLLGLVLYGILLLSRLSREEAGIVERVFGTILAALASWIYFTCFESSAAGATIGKMAVGIFVTDAQGQPLSYARANGRYWSKALSSLLGIGFLMAAFTRRKQALHDVIAGTLVVRRRPGETGI